MRRSIPILLVVLALSVTLAHNPTCMHDELYSTINTATYKKQVRLVSSTGVVKVAPVADGIDVDIDAQENPFHSIRIAVHAEDLENPEKYCSQVGDHWSIGAKENVQCRLKDVLTPEKKRILLEKIVPAAIKLHADRLRAQKIDEAILIPQFDQDICRDFTVPTNHSTVGVTGADFHFYLAAGPTPPPASAWSLTCGFLGDRPVAGVINFSPAYIADTNHAVRLMAHEMLHALGFNERMFAERRMIATMLNIRGKPESPVVNSRNVSDRAWKHYGCDTVRGMELEDQQDSGPVGSHWKRRNAKEDLMASHVGSGFYTAITMAAMVDTGFYLADYTKAERMTWGFGAGCDFLKKKCVENGNSLNEYIFCTEKDRNWLFCPSDRRSIGYCLNSPIGSVPPYFQYFSPYPSGSLSGKHMDHCPFVESHSSMGCSDADPKDVPGSLVGPNSRCFEAVGNGMKVIGTGKKVTGFCFPVACNSKTRTYTVLFKGSGVWVECTEQWKVFPSWYSPEYGTGQIRCPPYDDLCQVQDVVTDSTDTLRFTATMLTGAVAFLLTTFVN